MMEAIEQKMGEANGHKRMLSGQNSSVQSGGLIHISADNKVMDFLRLLEEYRRKCEVEGNY
jgi:hypothetical protein